LIVLLSAGAVVGLAALASVLFDLSFERAVLLAPVIVVSAGAVAGLIVLWGKAALEPIRNRNGKASPSDATRTLAGRDGLDDQALYAGSGEQSRRLDRD
jgi:hypothetical protein